MAAKRKKIRWWWRIALLIVPAAAWWGYIGSATWAPIQWPSAGADWVLDINPDSVGIRCKRDVVPTWVDELFSTPWITWRADPCFRMPWWKAVFGAHLFILPLLSGWWSARPWFEHRSKRYSHPVLWWRCLLCVIPLTWAVLWLGAFYGMLWITDNGLHVFTEKGGISFHQSWNVNHSAEFRWENSLVCSIGALRNNWYTFEPHPHGITIGTTTTTISPPVVAVLVSLFALPLVNAVRVKAIRRRRRMERRCAHCGYAHEGWGAEKCPECGEAARAISLKKPRPVTWRHRVLWAIPAVVWILAIIAVATQDADNRFDQKKSEWMTGQINECDTIHSTFVEDSTDCGIDVRLIGSWVRIAKTPIVRTFSPASVSRASWSSRTVLCYPVQEINVAQSHLRKCSPFADFFVITEFKEGWFIAFKLWFILLASHVFVLPWLIARRKNRRYQELLTIRNDLEHS